jgi:hypothetical protein
VPIQEEIWDGLEAPAQSDKQAVIDVLIGVAAYCCLSSIDFDIEHRVVDWLLNP